MERWQREVGWWVLGTSLCIINCETDYRGKRSSLTVQTGRHHPLSAARYCTVSPFTARLMNVSFAHTFVVEALKELTVCGQYEEVIPTSDRGRYR